MALHAAQGRKRGISEIDCQLPSVGDDPTYISFYVDVLDPAFAPGAGTPETGGMSTLQAQQVIRGLRGLNLVGADVVEVSLRSTLEWRLRSWVLR